MRQFIAIDSRMKEVVKCVIFSRSVASHDMFRCRQHSVKQHQSLDGPANRRGPPEPAPGSPIALYRASPMQVENAGAAVGASIRRGEAAIDQGFEEVVRLLAVPDTGERAVMSIHTDPRVQCHRSEEPTLTLRKP